MSHGPLLRIDDLSVHFPTPRGTVEAVNGVSFQLDRGERLGLVGESGSGKSVTAHSIMGLLRTKANVAGRALLEDVDLLRLRPRQMQRVRGARIGMVFQNPLNCLSPSMKIGDQITEAMLAHESITRFDAKERAIDLLQRVGIPGPKRSAGEYPHRFSGGMRQRVMIAMALSCNPDLIIADEPTTALDVTIQAQIIDLLVTICDEQNTAVILITHDLGLLAGFAERLVVMYAGRVVESGSVDTIYYGARHPYTWGLMTSITRLDEARRDRLIPIGGNPPSALKVPNGCAFHPRCPYAQERCAVEVPPLVQQRSDHWAACHFAGQLEAPERLGELVT